MKPLVQEYIKLVIEHHELLYTGDDKKANSVHAQITKIVLQIKNGPADLKDEYFALLEHSENSVKLWTATELLGTFEEKSIKILKKLDDGISSTAHAILHMWKNRTLTKDSWR